MPTDGNLLPDTPLLSDDAAVLDHYAESLGRPSTFGAVLVDRCAG